MADNAIKLDAALPKGSANGFNDPAVIKALLDDPTKYRVGICVFAVGKIETDTDSGDTVGKVRIHRIEGILTDTGGDASALERLLARAYERRTGMTVLDESLEAETRAAFDNIELDEGRLPLFNDEDDDVPN